MAIQINGTTVIDDSRNLTNVSIATNLCNAGSFEGDSNTVTLCGNTFDYTRLRSQKDITVCICNAPCGKPMVFDVGSTFGSTYCFKDINSNALATSVSVSATSATRIEILKNSNFCNFCAYIVSSTCAYASIPTPTLQNSDFVRGNMFGYNGCGICTLNPGINTGGARGVCFTTINCACGSCLSGSRSGINCPGCPNRNHSLLYTSGSYRTAIAFGGGGSWVNCCSFMDSSGLVYFCSSGGSAICESAGYFHCWDINWYSCTCGYASCCGCKIRGFLFADSELDVFWASVDEPGNPSGCLNCGSWRAFYFSGQNVNYSSTSRLTSAGFQATGLGIGGFVLDPTHASKPGTEPFFVWSGCGFARAYKGGGACPLCISNICCGGTFPACTNQYSYRAKIGSNYIMQCGSSSFNAYFINVKDLRGTTWCCDFTLNQAWCITATYSTGGGCWQDAITGGSNSFTPCVSPTGRWAAFPVWGGGPVGGYTFGAYIFGVQDGSSNFISLCTCPHVEWGIDECCIIARYTTNNACGCFGYRYCLCNAACENCGRGWFHQMNCADYQYYDNVCTCIPGCIQITMCIPTCTAGKGTCLCTTMPIDSPSMRLFPGFDQSTRKITRNNLFTSFNNSCTFNT